MNSEKTIDYPYNLLEKITGGEWEFDIPDDIVGKSYEYRQKYNDYKKSRMQAEKSNGKAQIMLDDVKITAV